jgi:hypothetical protein
MAQKPTQYTEHQQLRYKSLFRTLVDQGWFHRVSREGLPFAINQDSIGAYNLGFFMWLQGHEQTVDDMLELCEGATSIEHLKERLLAYRKMEFMEELGEEWIKQ